MSLRSLIGNAGIDQALGNEARQSNNALSGWLNHILNGLYRRTCSDIRSGKNQIVRWRIYAMFTPRKINPNDVRVLLRAVDYGLGRSDSFGAHTIERFDARFLTFKPTPVRNVAGLPQQGKRAFDLPISGTLISADRRTLCWERGPKSAHGHCYGGGYEPLFCSRNVGSGFRW